MLDTITNFMVNFFFAFFIMAILYLLGSVAWRYLSLYFRKPDKHRGPSGPPPPEHHNCRSVIAEEPDLVEYKAAQDSRTDSIMRENIPRGRTVRLKGKIKKRLPGGWFSVRLLFKTKDIEMPVLWICNQKTGDNLKPGDRVEVLKHTGEKFTGYFLTGNILDNSPPV